jgi:hypothetical protein
MPVVRDYICDWIDEIVAGLDRGPATPVVVEPDTPGRRRYREQGRPNV